MVIKYLFYMDTNQNVIKNAKSNLKVKKLVYILAKLPKAGT